jgi:hypothetical protein
MRLGFLPNSDVGEPTDATTLLQGFGLDMSGPSAS